MQKEKVGCRSGWVGEYLQDPGSYMVTVGLAKVAVACWVQRVDGWPKVGTLSVEERKHAGDIVAGVAPLCEVRVLDSRRDKELRLTGRVSPRASAAAPRNEFRRRMMRYCINIW